MIEIFHTRGRLVAAALLLVIGGCAPKPIVVHLTYAPPKPRVEIPPAITVHLSPLVDARSNQDALGQTTVPLLPGSSVVTWVEEGLLTLGQQGYAVSMSGSDPARGYRLRITIRRVYCRSALSSLRAAIVLSVEYFREGALLVTRQHRGEYNYKEPGPFEGSYRFSEGRVLDALNGGLADVVSQIDSTLKELARQ